MLSELLASTLTGWNPVSVSSILGFREPRATRYPFCLRIVPTAAPTWGPAPMINATRDIVLLVVLELTL